MIKNVHKTQSSQSTLLCDQIRFWFNVYKAYLATIFIYLFITAFNWAGFKKNVMNFMIFFYACIFFFYLIKMHFAGSTKEPRERAREGSEKLLHPRTVWVVLSHSRAEKLHVARRSIESQGMGRGVEGGKEKQKVPRVQKIAPTTLTFCI